MQRTNQNFVLTVVLKNKNMKAKLFAISIMAAFLFASFQSNAETEKRSVSSFSKISLRVTGKLYLKQCSPQSVEITAKSSTLEKIETEVKDGKLIIKFEDSNFFWRGFDDNEIIINITIPEIERLEVSGSGDILADGAIKTWELGLAISGSGDIKIAKLAATEVESSISGSGNIILAEGGGAKSLSIAISGSGDIDTKGFEAKSVTVKVSGSGDSSVYATESLDVRVSGSGDVYYAGSPEINSSVSGSGSVKKIR
jgi:hypothetical protein